MGRNSWGKIHLFIVKGKPVRDDIVYWVNKHSRWQLSNIQYHFLIFRSHVFKEHIGKSVS